MSGLREIEGCRPAGDGRRRRWFLDVRLELIVWYDQAGQPESFQLCYDKPLGEHAITWAPPGRWTHDLVDSGWDGQGVKPMPILEPDGPVPIERVAGEFRAAAAGIDHAVAEFVASRLGAIAAGRAVAPVSAER